MLSLKQTGESHSTIGRQNLTHLYGYAIHPQSHGWLTFRYLNPDLGLARATHATWLPVIRPRFPIRVSFHAIIHTVHSCLIPTPSPDICRRRGQPKVRVSSSYAWPRFSIGNSLHAVLHAIYSASLKRFPLALPLALKIPHPFLAHCTTFYRSSRRPLDKVLGGMTPGLRLLILLLSLPC